MLLRLNESIDSLPRTRPQTIYRLKKLDIKTYWDLLNYFPGRYENYSLISQIADIQSGEIVTLKGKIKSIKYEITRKGLKLQKVIISDSSAELELVWYNQPYLLRIFQPGMLISVAGEAKKFLHSPVMEPKEYEILNSPDQECLHTGRIIPVYPEKNGLSSRVLREKISYLFKNFNLENTLDEYLPKEIITFNNLLSEAEAYKNIHFPENPKLKEEARNRLSFDELFIIQLSTNLIKKSWQKDTVSSCFNIEKQNLALQQKFISNLPFQLTSAQKRVVSEITSDLSKVNPMNRFLQGEVGSGKTIVAACAIYLSYLNQYQSLLMAPTEILAEQHYRTVSSLFKDYDIKIGLQTGSKKINQTKTKDKLIDYDVVIGTHALFNEKLKFHNVGLVVIDEQHRFGVVQRALLKSKGINPHLLTMTATPIPRTVMLTLYNELDLSVIDEMPKGRLPVKTFLVSPHKRNDGYRWISKQIKTQGTQVFIICPLIEESEIETMKSVKAAAREYDYLKKDIFPDLKLGLLHGKIKSREKNKIMEDFKDKKYDILVATSVVEVGIDIPNATIMVIEGAERYGLAQLHQLRGRVGRCDKQSYCLLFTDAEMNKVKERLQYFSQNNNGMEIAEYDLRLRGPGEVFGQRQHGFRNLKIASLTDYNLINQTKKAAHYFLNKHNNLDLFDELKKRIANYRISLISRD